MYKAINKKNEKEYIVLNDNVINATNADNGALAVLYANKDGELFIRNKEEFNTKFIISSYERNTLYEPSVLELSKVCEAISLPCQYDDMGQFIVDQQSNILLDVRGNAVLNKSDTKLQDAFGQLVAMAINKYIKEEITK